MGDANAGGPNQNSFNNLYRYFDNYYFGNFDFDKHLVLAIRPSKLNSSRRLMSEYHFPVPGINDDRILFYSRRHWATLIGPMFLVSVLAILPILIFIGLSSLNLGFIKGIGWNFVVIFTSVYYLIVATYAFTEWVNYYFDMLIITDEEVIDINQEGFFNHKITQVSILRIQDVSAQIKGYIPTFFGYGSVIAESAGENSRTYVIDGIPNPIEIANRIIEMHNELTENGVEGFHHDNVGGHPKKIEPIQGKCPPEPIEKPQENHAPNEGEIDKDDLNQGGQIKL